MADENTTENEAPAEEVVAEAGATEAVPMEAGAGDEQATEAQPRTLTDFAELAAVATGTTAPDRPAEETSNEPQIDEHGRSYATGRRKDAVAYERPCSSICGSLEVSSTGRTGAVVPVATAASSAKSVNVRG